MSVTSPESNSALDELIGRSKDLGAMLPPVIIPEEVTDELRGVLKDYIDTETEVQRNKGNLPASTDEWGCVAAAAAFALNNVMKPEVPLDAAFFDTALEREPNAPSSITKATLWFLENGYKVSKYDWGETTDAEDSLPLYLSGELTFDQYLVLYEKEYGPVEKDHIELLKSHLNNVVGPLCKLVDEQFPHFTQIGLLCVQDIDPRRITSLVDQHTAGGDTVLVEYGEDDGDDEGLDYAVHCRAIYRPDPSSPLTIFSPDEDESGIRVYSQFDVADIIRTANSFIALRSLQLTKKQ